MKKAIFIAALFLLSAGSAKAQHVDVFGGYSFVHFDEAPQNANLNGWNLALDYHVKPVVGIVGDFSGTYGSPPEGSTGLRTYLFGPQFSVPGRISPFFRVMFGAGHVDVDGIGSTSIATAIGGGLDLGVAPHIAVRAIQFDDVITRFGASTQNNPRVSVGVVIRF